MIEAFVDESGSHQDAPILCVGAYVAEHDEWTAFETGWRPQLVAAGMEYFHAKDNRCDDLREPLAAAIQARQIFGWMSTVDTIAYREFASHELMSTMGNAYAIATFQCATKICLWAKSNGLGPVAFIIEHGQANVKFVQRMLEMFIGHSEIPVASVAVASKTEFVPLQAADFLAHSGSTDDRPWLDRLVGDGPGKARQSHVTGATCEQWSETQRALRRQYRYRMNRLKNGLPVKLQ